MQELETQQAENGGWGTPCPVNHQVAAAFHLVPVYAALGRPVPRLGRLGKLAAAMRFESAKGFLPMDAAYVVRAAVAGKALSREEAARFYAHLEALLSADDVDDRHLHVAAAQLAYILSEWRGHTVFRDAWAANLWRLP